jgi:long-chain fatty acid transport protein
MSRHRIALFTVALMTASSEALAGGMFLPTRGVRPTARAGAFVAGADDAGALWFNPAGLARLSGGDEMHALFDLGYVDQRASYTRIDSGLNQRDTVRSSGGTPVPTLGFAVDAGRDLVIAGGLLAPYGALGSFSADGPQRYSLVDMSHSAIAMAELAVGWRATDWLRVGAGLQSLYTHLISRTVLSGCPGETVCAPEDPAFDSMTQLDQKDWFSPSAIVGAQADLGDRVRLGAAVQLPFEVEARGRLDVTLPPSSFFDGASVAGDRATTTFTLPAALRIAAEVDVAPRWRVELGVDYERWSMHDRMRVEPDQMSIEETAGVGSYQVGPMEIRRAFEDTVAIKLGAEGRPLADSSLSVAAGYAYETAASPDRYLSVLTVDGDKQLLAAGAGIAVARATRVQVTLSYVAVEDREVSPDEGRAEQLTPIRETDAGATPTYVNWGSYRSSWIIAGIGLASEF